MKARFLVLVMVLGLVSMTPAVADTVEITGFGDPISSPELAGGTVIDFDSEQTGFFFNLTIGSVTFGTLDARPFEVGRDFDGVFNASDVAFYTRGGIMSFTFAFSTPVDAFAFNWGAAAGPVWELQAFDLTSSLLETVLLPATGSGNAGEFFGIATPDIAFVTLINTTDFGNIQAPSNFAVIDNFTFNTVTVPEPATFALLAAGLLGLGAFRKRFKRFKRFKR